MEEEKIGPALPKPQAAPEETKGPPPPQPQAARAREVRVETDLYAARFTNRGARLKSFVLKSYRASVDKDSPPLEMVSSAPSVPYPLGIRLQTPTPFNDEALLYSVQGHDLKLTDTEQGTLLFQAETPTGLRLTKKFTFTGSSYPIEIEVSVTGSTNGPPALLLTSDGGGKGADKGAAFEGLLALVNKKIKHEPLAELKKGTELSGPVSWAGFGYTYFLSVLLPENGAEKNVAVREVGPALVMEIQAAGKAAPETVSRYTLFIGPKVLEVLKSVDRELDRSIDFGYFAFISIPLLYVMHFSHQLTGSYGIDIILLTVLLKLLTAPLTHKSFVSMRQMQKLQPQMEKIKEKFKDDRERMNKEIMELYRRNKVNPLGGCLPMVLQIPIFIGLYNALLTPIELRHAPFLWIKDLSRPDWESLPVALAGWHIGIPILTLLMGASMFLQQWMTPSAGDPNQRKMMMFMPVVFTVMFINFPSGLTIYWLVNNVLSIAQQYLINRMQR